MKVDVHKLGKVHLEVVLDKLRFLAVNFGDVEGSTKCEDNDERTRHFAVVQRFNKTY